MNDEITLLPCPFCGNSKNLSMVNEKHDHSGGYFIACPECGASTIMRYAMGDDPKPLLIEAWNRRAAVEAAQPEAVGESALIEVIRERDERDRVIDAILDLVLGKDRPEWSSAYGFNDAVNDVDEHMVSLAAPPTESQPAEADERSEREEFEKILDNVRTQVFDTLKDWHKINVAGHEKDHRRLWMYMRNVEGFLGCLARGDYDADRAPTAPAQAEPVGNALQIADAIDPFTRKQAPDHLTMGVAASLLRALATPPSAATPEPSDAERLAFEADPELTPAAFAERLARHMKGASLTAKEVSELTGVSETTLSRLKNHGRMPDAISYAALCNFMGWHPHIRHRLAIQSTKGGKL